jgi:hypothetical protein
MVIVAIALIALTPTLAMVGAPVEMVGVLSAVSLLVLAVAFVALVVAASRRVRSQMMLALTALVTQVLATLLLLVQEPQPAFLHPEWSWYWPVVNTLYFGGLLVTLVSIISGAIGLAVTRSGAAAAALAMAGVALALNRLAPYR